MWSLGEEISSSKRLHKREGKKSTLLVSAAMPVTVLVACSLGNSVAIWIKTSTALKVQGNLM